MTITDVLRTIEKMRNTYNFKNDDTHFSIESDFKTHSCNIIRLETFDYETSTSVYLEREVLTGEDE